MSLTSIVEDFRKFALVCSGANLQTLDKEDCAREKTKYVMIGMFIFLTAVSASLSCGYALYIGFKSAWLAACLGMLWGVFIFNLDRFIISSLRKKQIDAELPLSKKLGLWLGELMAAFPRLLLAILIALVISVPLELKYFEPEINARVKKAQDADINKIRNDSLKENGKINELKDENQSLRQAIFDKEKRRDQLRNDSLQEAEGTGGSRMRGIGPITELRREELRNYERELAKFRNDSQAKIDLNEKEIAGLEAERDKETEALIKEREKGDGFLEHYKALKNLEKESDTVWWASIFISFLLIVIETAPIAMKVMARRGPYDSTLEAEEYRINLAQQKKISDINEETNYELFSNTLKRSARFTAQEQLTQEIMNEFFNLAQYDIAEAKVAAAKDVIDDWRSK